VATFGETAKLMDLKEGRHKQLTKLVASIPDPLHFGEDPDPDPGNLILQFSSMTFRTPTKTNKKKFSAYFFLKLHLHHFSKIKSPKEVAKQ
jgi:hypothetical protein